MQGTIAEVIPNDFCPTTNLSMTKNSKSSLLRYEELPEWATQFAHPFIRTGYRRCPCNSTGTCARSVLKWHNESMNIWTHLVPGSLYLLYAVWGLSSGMDVGTLVMAVCCFFGFIASSLFHTMVCHSESMAKLCVRIDLLGVVLSLTGVCANIIFHLEACQPQRRGRTFQLLGTAVAVLAFTCSRKEFAHRRWRHVKPLPFVALGGALLYPMAVWAMDDSCGAVAQREKLPVVRYLALGWSLDFAAVFAFMWRVPERWIPGAFDYLGNSHNIFHVLVVCASICGLAAGQLARQGNWCVCAPESESGLS